MRIRSITCFCNPSNPDFPELLNSICQLQTFCKAEFEKIGWEIQTSRLATTSFGAYTLNKTAVKQICELEKIASEKGFTYLSIGPARITQPGEFALIPEIIAATSSVFCNGILTHQHRGISTAAAKACAKTIVDCAGISPDGFANLRFCAMSHVKPFTPFFPAAYSYGRQPAFALAIESADAAMSAFEGALDASEGCRKLLDMMNTAAEKLSPIAKQAQRKFDISFKGFDFSLAPFPGEWCSLGKAMENVGVPAIGFMGSLTAAALLADTLDRGSWLRTGFNGLMLPVLEDSTLAARSETSHFTIKDLLLYSAVCGTGLDTVPLPGDISAEMIEPLLLDISALSLRLNKPLTARLMPVPGLKSGDKTVFDFDFFKNGRIMDYPAAALNRVLSSSKWLEIHQRIVK